MLFIHKKHCPKEAKKFAEIQRKKFCQGPSRLAGLGSPWGALSQADAPLICSALVSTCSSGMSDAILVVANAQLGISVKDLLDRKLHNRHSLNVGNNITFLTD